ncbi:MULTISPECIES: type IV secretory system conjugative DNA transfer family protein [unclassified Caballeronia]|uniref:type IV secretory system conjugative DNA transfer family protein n=1 Tax=unclassified Caballeronia TaxID=2646786 RepID=UPI00285BE2FF|nr:MULTISPECIES: type IV secretory system conjugative DNA transfer family protein [unclassified Caballeronia]MDR5776996.1 type IV secretory system conjugative DNA transfer family protein [Caballeronia sp. LZ002]MDR5852429.1 type IV secretory system conjugative DNA transfer family protein [Caballeronia sp. LZ003]
MLAGQSNRSVHFSASIIVAFLFGMALSSWAATQYFAHAVQYQDGLGEYVWKVGPTVRIYQPFSWFGWAAQWMNSTKQLETYVTRMLLVLCGGGVLSLLGGFFLYYRRSLKSEKHDDLHGSARWANERDIEKMGLVTYERWEGPLFRRKRTHRKASGPYLGAFDTSAGRKVLRYSDPAHLACAAPSRSGKGVGPVLTTLLSYPASTAVNDIKGENYELSSGFRHSAGSLVIKFDPTSVDQKSIDGRSRYNAAAYWNVLDEIRTYTEYDVMDAQNVSQAIADPDGEGMDDHWVSTSYELLVGVILHVKYYERDKSLSGVSTYLADPSFTDPEQMYTRMMNAEHDPDGSMGWLDSEGNPTKTHPQVAIAARAMLNKEEKERNSVLSTAKTKLSLYTEPIVARNTSRSDFCVNDLMNHEKPVSLYIVIPPSDKNRLRPLVRLFITFLILRLTRSMGFEDGRGVKDYRHRLLLLVDELASLKKMEQLQDALSYMAGYGITAFLFFQDWIQLREAYGDKETITAGCQLRIAYAPNTIDTAEDVSKMTGITTVKRQNVSYSGTRMGAMLGQMSVSEELVERPLLTADEASRLPRDEMLIFNTGHPPIRAKKLRYFEMPVFQQRAAIASPSRVCMTFSEGKGLGVKWFMVAVERVDGAKDLNVTINTYSDFPEVTLVVKQEHVERETVLEFEFGLFDTNGQPINRALAIEDLSFVARPLGDCADFEPNEAFELHFMVKDSSSYKRFSQAGFYRDMSVYEREARRKVRKLFHDFEAVDGTPTEATVERVVEGGKYAGKVLLVTRHYIAIHKHHDREQVSLHRIAKLNRSAKEGESITITYSGRKGVVV